MPCKAKMSRIWKAMGRSSRKMMKEMVKVITTRLKATKMMLSISLQLHNSSNLSRSRTYRISPTWTLSSKQPLPRYSSNDRSNKCSSS